MFAALLVNAGILAAIFLYNRYFGPGGKWGPEVEKPDDAVKGVPQYPRAVEDQPIPLLFGLVKVMGPNVIWTAGKRATPIEDEAGTIINYQYELAVSMVCGIPMESELQNPTARRMWLGDKLAWPAPSHSGSMEESPTPNPIIVELGEPIGEYENRATGVVFWMPGTADQEYPDDVRDLYDIHGNVHLLPDYHRQCVLTFTALDAAHQGFLWGFDPNLPAIAVEIKTTGESNILGSFIGQIGDGEANPVMVLFRLLVQKWGGTGRYTVDQIDLESFRLAAITLVEEQHGYSGIVYNEREARGCVEEILSQIDGILYDDHAQGKLVLKLIRDDYDTETDPIIRLHPGNVVEIGSYTATTWAELYNRVTVNYTDRDHDYKTRSVTVSNEAGIEAANGVVRGVTYDFPTVCDRFIASRLASRQLKALSVPTIRVRLIVGRECWNTKPGDVVVWTWPEYGITDMVLRVAAVNTGLLTDNKVMLDCFSDRFSVQEPHVDLPTAVILPIPAPAPLLNRFVTEAPRWMLRQIALLGGPSDADVQRGYYLAEQVEDGTTYLARIERDDLGLRSTDTQTLTFPFHSKVAFARDRTADPYSTGTHLVIDWDADFYDQLETATASQIRNEGRNLLLVGGEFMAFESFVGVEGLYIILSNVWSGLLDTPQTDHAVGEDVWLLSPPWLGAVGGFGLSLDEVVDVKLIPRGFLSPMSDDDAESDVITIRVRTLLPYPPANVRLAHANQTSSTRDPAPLEEDDIYLTWAQRERTTDTIVRGDAVNETLDDTTYDIVGRVYGEDAEWVEILTDINNDDRANVHLSQVGHGELEIGLRGRRPDPDGGADLESWDVAALRMICKSWRNLLANGDFTDSVISDAWTVASGDVAQGSTGSERLGKNGYYLTTDGASASVDISQTVRLDGYRPSRMFAYLEFYDHALTSATGDDTVTVTLYAMNSEGTVLQSTAYGPTTPSKTEWTWHQLSITNLHPQTDRLKVRIQLGTSGANPDGAVTEFRLRVGQVSAELLTNPSFSAGTKTGWTEDGTWNITTTTPYADPSYIRPADQVYATLSQSPAVPAGFEYGTVLVTFAQMNDDTLDTGQVNIIAYDASVNAIGVAASYDVTTDGEAISPINTWVRRRAYLELPSSGFAPPATIQVLAEAERVSGTPLNVCFDDFSCRIFKDLGPTVMNLEFAFDTPNVQYLPQTIGEWKVRFPDIPVPDYGFWNGTSFQGIQGYEPEMLAYDPETGDRYPVTLGGFTGGPWNDDNLLVTDCIDFPLTENQATQGHLFTYDRQYANFTKEDFTVLVVFKSFNASDSEILGRWDDSTDHGWAIKILDDGTPWVRLGDGSTSVSLTGGEQLRGGLPQFIALTYEAGTDTMRMITPAGQQIADCSGLGDISKDDLQFRIGRASAEFSANPHIGQIARIYIWRKAISASLFGDDFWNDALPFEDYDNWEGQNRQVAVVIGEDEDGPVVARIPPYMAPFVYRDALAEDGESGWGYVLTREHHNYAEPLSAFVADANTETYYGEAGVDRFHSGSRVVVGDREHGMYRPYGIRPAPSGPNLFIKWFARGLNEDTTNGILVLEDQSGASQDVCEFDLTETLQEYRHQFRWTGGVRGWDMTNISGAAFGSGASSSNLLPRDGYVQFRASHPSLASRLVGFSTSDPDQNYTTVGWGILLDNAGNLQVRENGVNPFNTTYVEGDLVRIERISGTIYYKKNGSTVYTSGTTSTAPLLVDTSLNTGATANEIRLFDSSLNYEIGIQWQNLVGVSLDYTPGGGTPIGDQRAILHFYPHDDVAAPTPDPFDLSGDPETPTYAMEVDYLFSATPDFYPNVYATDPDDHTINYPSLFLVTTDFVNQFNAEGEIIIEGICEEETPTDATILDVTTSGNTDTRTFSVDFGRPLFSHYDGSNVGVDSYGPQMDWRELWAIRMRWCRAGLLEHPSVYAGIRDFDSTWALTYPPPESEEDPPFGPLPTYGRSSTFSINQFGYVVSEIRFAPTGDWQGILRRVTFTCREEILP